MALDRSYAWRVLFVAGGALVMIGGPQHPGGTMLEMLEHPAWFRAHALVFAGMLAWTVGLWLFRRQQALGRSLDRWLLVATVVTALQTLEMGVHTMAYLDAGALAAGSSTPVLTTHLWLTVVIYPIFGLVTIGLIGVGARDRALGSHWIGWLGMLGAAGHGAAGLLVVGFEIGWARMLFPFIVLLALWFLLAGIWPARPSAVGVRAASVDGVREIETTGIGPSAR